jgi:hypothetical protein
VESLQQQQNIMITNLNKQITDMENEVTGLNKQVDQ